MTDDSLFAQSDLNERAVSQAALDAAEEQLQSLCALHAGTFVGVERRSRALQEGLEGLLQAVSTAQERVVEASQALDPEGGSDEPHKEDSSLAALAEKHRVRRRTLLQHSSLLELLELASLMDACVRSGLYEEALSIAAFANTLERRHGTASGGGPSAADSEKQQQQSGAALVVSRVIQQIRLRQVDLRQHLLQRLKSHVTMPVCLEIVTALRRLNSIDLERTPRELERVHAAMEVQLQIEFLEARDAWLESNSTVSAPLGSIPTNSNSNLRASLGAMQPTEQLLDAIERYRTRVFEVATEFNAIFRAQSAANATTNGHDRTTATTSLSLLSMWLARRIHSFLTLLQSQLVVVDDSAALRDALEASVFFASSMGRLGADFTPQLAGVFESRMLALVTKTWKDGAQQLTETLGTCRQAQVNFPLVAAVVSATSGSDGTGTAAAAVDPSGGTDGIVLNPPRQLLAYPPLARFVNAILQGLNELRRCLLPGIFPALVQELQRVLTAARQDLVAHERAVLVPGFRGEAAALRDTAARYLKVWDDVVAPYAQGSLHAALGDGARARECYRLLAPPEPAAATTTAADSVEETEAAESADRVPAEIAATEEATERTQEMQGEGGDHSDHPQDTEEEPPI